MALFCVGHVSEVSFIKKYSFRTGNGDEIIENILESMHQTSRSQYIKEAIRFYANTGIEVKRLNQQIEKLLSGDLCLSIPALPIKKELKKDVSIDILESSIEDLLNL